MNSTAFRKLSMLITLIFAASLMVFVTGVFAQSATPAGETEITGQLEKIGSGTIVVSGQTISVIGAEFNGLLVVGSTVKVHVSTVNGVVTAREVETTTLTPADDNSNTNANTNTNSNANDNTNVNSNANVNSNTNANSNSNSNDNTDDNSNDNTSVVPGVNLQQAIDIVLTVYPTTDILSVELTTKFGGTQVWEVKIRNGIEVNVDAQSAAILTIDRRGDDNSSGNSNGNSNDNSDDGANSNGNVNSNSNDNNDDHGGDNGNMNSNDNNDDNGGNDNNDDHGGDNGNSGSGGGDDNGGNSGHGGGDD